MNSIDKITKLADVFEKSAQQIKELNAAKAISNSDWIKGGSLQNSLFDAINASLKDNSSGNLISSRMIILATKSGKNVSARCNIVWDDNSLLKTLKSPAPVLSILNKFVTDCNAIASKVLTQIAAAGQSVPAKEVVNINQDGSPYIKAEVG
jgi:hypothetical protein